MRVFRVVERLKTETDKGIKYRVRFKAVGAQHVLTLVSDSSDIFKGYPIGGVIDVEIKQQQTTLEGKAS